MQSTISTGNLNTRQNGTSAMMNPAPYAGTSDLYLAQKALEAFRHTMSWFDEGITQGGWADYASRFLHHPAQVAVQGLNTTKTVLNGAGAGIGPEEASLQRLVDFIGNNPWETLMMLDGAAGVARAGASLSRLPAAARAFADSPTGLYASEALARGANAAMNSREGLAGVRNSAAFERYLAEAARRVGETPDAGFLSGFDESTLSRFNKNRNYQSAEFPDYTFESSPGYNPLIDGVIPEEVMRFELGDDAMMRHNMDNFEQDVSLQDLVGNPMETWTRGYSGPVSSERLTELGLEPDLWVMADDQFKAYIRDWVDMPDEARQAWFDAAGGDRQEAFIQWVDKNTPDMMPSDPQEALQYMIDANEQAREALGPDTLERALNDLRAEINRYRDNNPTRNPAWPYDESGMLPNPDEAVFRRMPPGLRSPEAEMAFPNMLEITPEGQRLMQENGSLIPSSYDGTRGTESPWFTPSSTWSEPFVDGQPAQGYVIKGYPDSFVPYDLGRNPMIPDPQIAQEWQAGYLSHTFPDPYPMDVMAKWDANLMPEVPPGANLNLEQLVQQMTDAVYARWGDSLGGFDVANFDTMLLGLSHHPQWESILMELQMKTDPATFNTLLDLVQNNHWVNYMDSNLFTQEPSRFRYNNGM